MASYVPKSEREKSPKSHYIEGAFMVLKIRKEAPVADILMLATVKEDAIKEANRKAPAKVVEIIYSSKGK